MRSRIVSRAAGADVVSVKDVIPSTKRLLIAWRPWLRAGAVIGASVVAVLVLITLTAPLPIQGPNLSQLDQARSKRRSFARRSRALQLQNASTGNQWTGLLPFVPLIVAGLGLIATAWHQLNERAEQRRQEAREAKREDIRRFSESLEGCSSN